MNKTLPVPAVIDFGGGKHEVKLTMKTARTLQDVRQTSIGVLYKRVALSDYFIDDLVETVCYGLVGGGMKLADATKLIETYGEYYDYDEWHLMAQLILNSVKSHTKEDTGGEVDGKKPTLTADGST